MAARAMLASITTPTNIAAYFESEEFLFNLLVAHFGIPF